MPCYDGRERNDPPRNNESTLEFFLCRACQYLSKEDLNAIKHPIQEMTLLDWYREHFNSENNI